MADQRQGQANEAVGIAQFAAVYGVIAALIVLAIALSPLATRRPARAHGALAGATVDDAGAPRTGLIVTSLRTDGEAARAGLRPGDDIVAIDHHRILSRRDAAHLLRRHRGQSVVVDIARDGHRSRVRLTLGGGKPHGA
jgi:S1-C subfamily serine protease